VAGGHVAHELARYLTLLGAIGSIAPLLGLLGTVVGMIQIFSSQQAGTNPQQLAQGISVALYSTAFGIIVAVPSCCVIGSFARASTTSWCSSSSKPAPGRGACTARSAPNRVGRRARGAHAIMNFRRGYNETRNST